MTAMLIQQGGIVGRKALGICLPGAFGKNISSVDNKLTKAKICKRDRIAFRKIVKSPARTGPMNVPAVVMERLTP